ncbi:hypothetical protein MMC17_004825 [Xylographa soralifera]|nr:hypothetical protein [Xylographa soralifera]
MVKSGIKRWRHTAGKEAKDNQKGYPPCEKCLKPETPSGVTSPQVQTQMLANYQAQQLQLPQNFGYHGPRIISPRQSDVPQQFIQAGFASGTGIWASISNPNVSRPQPQMQGRQSDASGGHGYEDSEFESYIRG